MPDICLTPRTFVPLESTIADICAPVTDPKPTLTLDLNTNPNSVVNNSTLILNANPNPLPLNSNQGAAMSALMTSGSGRWPGRANVRSQCHSGSLATWAVHRASVGR